MIEDVACGARWVPPGASLGVWLGELGVHQCHVLASTPFKQTVATRTGTGAAPGPGLKDVGREEHDVSQH